MSLPNPGFEIDPGNTALVITDPQNDFLSPEGVTWGVVGESVTENRTVDNIEALLRAAKEADLPVFISPHYYYPHDHGWKFEGTLERLMHDIQMFDRKGPLHVDGFEGSGADWLERYKPYINDGKTVVVGPHKVFGPETNDLVLQLRKRGIDKVILGGMSANLCVESHLRELLEQGFEVAVVKDATAAAKLPDLDGYEAACTNYRMLSSRVYDTDEAVREIVEAAGSTDTSSPSELTRATGTGVSTGALLLAVLTALLLGLSTTSSLRAADTVDGSAAQKSHPEATATAVRHHTVEIEGLDIFYREAGPKDAPTVLLLHGFPTSSHMFRNLIPALADRYHVVAPDYPGYGNSSMPSVSEFDYSFDRFADIIEKLVAKLDIERYSLYLMDYGAPVGFRIATRAPERVDTLIVQNGNAYVEGLREFWDPLRAYWNEPTKENGDALRNFLNLDATRWQYTHGVADVSRISPDNWNIDQRLLDRPGNQEIQLAMFLDYGTNPGLYPAWQRYMREHQPPTLLVWGKNDVIFPAEGAYPYKRDLKNLEFHLFDTGHFALEEKGEEIASLMRSFLDRNTKN